MKIIRYLLLCASCLMLLLPSPILAIPLTFDFAGTAIVTAGIFLGQGTNVTGSYTYDSDLVDSSGAGEEDVFSAHILSNQSFQWNIAVTLGTTTRSTSTNLNLAPDGHHLIHILDTSAEDRYKIESLRQVITDDAAQILLSDFDPLPDPDAVLAGSGGLTNSAPLLAPDVSKFSDNCLSAGLFTCSAYIAFNDVTGDEDGRVFFRVDSITARSVPEPATLLLVALGMFGFAFSRREASRQYSLTCYLRGITS